MNFGEALAALKEGKKVTRSVWGGYWRIAPKVAIMLPFENGMTPTDAIPMNNVIIAYLKTGGAAPAMPYQEDILAEDWLIIE